MSTFADDLVAYYSCDSEYDLWDRFKVTLTGVSVSPGTGIVGDSWDFGVFTPKATPIVSIPNPSGVFTISLWFKGLNSGNKTAISLASNHSPLRIASGGTDLGVRDGSGLTG